MRNQYMEWMNGIFSVLFYFRRQFGPLAEVNNPGENGLGNLSFQFRMRSVRLQTSWLWRWVARTTDEIYPIECIEIRLHEFTNCECFD